MLQLDAMTAVLRGPLAEIDALRDALAQDPSEQERAALWERFGLPATDAEEVLAPVRTALSAPSFGIDVQVSGPGGHQTHLISAGFNAVGVRRSPLRDDLGELSAFPFINLPGGITRLVRFRPGFAPELDAPALEVEESLLVGLAAEDGAERVRAGEELRELLTGFGFADDEDSSWQLVRVGTAWTNTRYEETGDFSAHVRVGRWHFLVVEEDGALLLPVPSIAAWESLLRPLPGMGDIGRPRAGADA